MKKTFVLDWDGTATDNYERSKKILENIVKTLSARYDIDEKRLLNIYDKQKAKILANDKEYKWIHKGHASSYCEDPLILNNASLVEILKILKPEEDISILWAEILTFFARAYKITAPTYVPQLLEILKYLKEKGEILVVTNSDPQKVSEELKIAPFDINVIGHAKKYKITCELEEIEESMTSKDGRKINLRRGEYYKILRKFNPLNSYVIGDGFSCDLSLPMALGFNTILVSDFETMQWAKNESSRDKNSMHIKSLCSLLDTKL